MYTSFVFCLFVLQHLLLLFLSLPWVSDLGRVDGVYVFLLIEETGLLVGECGFLLSDRENMLSVISAKLTFLSLFWSCIRFYVKLKLPYLGSLE